MDLSTSSHQQVAQQISPDTINNPVCGGSQCSSQVLLGTLQIRIVTKTSQPSMPIRGLCDSGSQINLITMDCLQRLQLKAQASRTLIAGIGDTISLQGMGHIVAALLHRDNDDSHPEVRFTVVSRVTSRLPSTILENYFAKEIRTEDLADPQYWLPAEVDVLIGAGLWASIVQSGVMHKTDSNNVLLAQNTQFGWVISGHLLDRSNSRIVSLHLRENHSTEADMLSHIDRLVRRFWEIESIPAQRIRSHEEIRCDEIFASTHSRGSDGRYVVTIPFRTDCSSLGSSRHIALKRFLQLERRMERDPALAEKYKAFIKDYIDSGHMIPAPPAPTDPSKSYYIPYHAITKRKFRFVFDSSCDTSSGVSLNDLQLSGRWLQDDLCRLFIRFRFRKFAVTADVVQMFRQVWVHKSQWNFQRILVRLDPNGPIMEFYIVVIVWGMVCATHNAVSALLQCAIDGAKKFPLASKAALGGFYVDNLLTGTDDEDSLMILYHQISAMYSTAGFQLAKWATNSARVGAEFAGVSDHSDQKPLLADILGSTWHVNTDTFTLGLGSTDTALSYKSTKAQVIGVISSVYDPSGLLAPAILIGKLIMQDFWRESKPIGWTDVAPRHLIDRCTEFQMQIRCAADMHIKRWTGGATQDELELHVFTDASERAYGAVAYLLAISSTGKRTCNLLTARSRVAPIKVLTIPRLELLGVLMGVKLSDYIKQASEFNNIRTYFWTDSTIVLHWIKKDPSKMSTFVATRITQILELSTVHQWSHIRSQHNPADVLSRGMATIQLQDNDLWWHGPNWLCSERSLWPSQPSAELSTEEKMVDATEAKRSAKTDVSLVNLARGDSKMDELSVKNDSGQFVSLIDRRSTLAGVIRVTAYVYRFVENARASFRGEIVRPTKTASPPYNVEAISIQERKHALDYWIRMVQKKNFHREILAAQSGSELPRDSKLLKFTPHWNADDHTLRMGGRLQYSELSFDEKHPILLADHTLVQRLIRDVHLRSNHGGPQLCIAILRQKFWILRLRQLIRTYITKCCVQCIRHSKAAAQQLMAPLPAARTTPAPPFSRVGVDFAGPFQLRRTAATQAALRKAVTQTPVQPTTVKGWVVIFICLVTRAVHLDVVRSLHIEAFLECFAKMTARRGPCSEIWSDNGTTFTGTNTELQRVLREWENKFPEQQFADMGVKWRFITPGAPFKGGIWEAAVKTFKYHFYRVLNTRILTPEQMYTLVVQIEACMNARPLFAQTDDHRDLNPITPAHLVIGRSTLQCPLTEDVHEIVDNRLTIWGLQQKLYQQFWTQWKEDYIAGLQKRNKWYVAQRNLKPGDMVLIQDENTPPSRWPLGRIQEVFLSTDGLVRSAAVRISTINRTGSNRQQTTTVLQRPVQKLCILLPDDQQPMQTAALDVTSV